MRPAKAVRTLPKTSKAFEAPVEVCDLLRELGTPESACRGTTLFRKGDPPAGVFLITSGRVALSAGDDPCRITRIAGVRSLLGLPSTVGDRAYTLTAEAVTDVELCHIAPDAFRNALASNPVIGMAIVRILSDEVSALRRFAVYNAERRKPECAS